MYCVQMPLFIFPRVIFLESLSLIFNENIYANEVKKIRAFVNIIQRRL
jgi:hypothetical protein